VTFEEYVLAWGPALEQPQTSPATVGAEGIVSIAAAAIGVFGPKPHRTPRVAGGLQLVAD
jgi:hypothetical protein